MKSNCYLWFAACSMFVSAVSADNFMWEAGAEYSKLDGDFSESSQTSVDATYYLTPVRQNAGPLGEAVFLSRSSFVNVRWSDADIDEPQVSTFESAFLAMPLPDRPLLPPTLTSVDAIFSSAFLPFQPPTLSAEESDFTIAMRYVTRGGYITQANFTSGDGSSGFSNSFFSSRTDLETNALNFQFGQYITPQTVVILGYGKRESDQDRLSGSLFCFPLPNCEPPPAQLTLSDESTESWSVNAKHLLFQGEATHSITGGISYEVSEVNVSSLLLDDSNLGNGFSDKSYATILRAGYTYYPMRTLGVGLSLSRTDAENGETTQLGTQAEWFIRPNIALGVAYRRVNTKQEFLDVDSDGWALSVKGRF